jgi:two-component system sensor histidine kinase PhoQ
VILRWGLAPLRRVINDLQAIESGRQTQLEGAYPKELKGLTDNLNKLINNERDHLARYRNTLGNLAHSLKTPLAVLRGEVENSSENDLSKRTMSEQVNRMSQIVEYQLQRAATSGRSAITARVKTLDVVSKIINALNKVYADKNIIVDMQVDESSRFQGDEGDLMEMLGNLLDNAYKCCKNQVRISSKATGASKPGSSPDFELFVEDDGPGMHEDQIEKLLERGVRGDLDTKGHGIGLAMVNDIIEIYSGTLSIDKSDLGGSRIKVHVPLK